MTANSHYRGLERLYLAGPINEFFHPTIHIGEGVARVEISVTEQLHHTAGAAHGSVYFKMLDDAAFFAANSLESEVFMLTTAFNTYFTRPISSGVMRAEGRVVNQNRSQIISEAVVYDEDGREVGRGSGLFVRSRIPLVELPGYTEAAA